jgi:5'-3' exonuclease
MICIIDGDTVAFACAASAEDTEEPWIACGRAKEMLANILADCETNSYEVWLSGKNNFRYSVYPEYKANRIGAYRPKWEKEVKQYLTDQWGANWSDGCEADDMVGRRLIEVGDNGILAHIDKDLNQITGWHYNWELRRNGEVIREAKKYFVSPEEGDNFFWYQLLVGDTTDNIKGVPGIGPKKAEKLLRECKDNQSAYKVCQDLYSCEEELDMNAQCLYIHRKPNDSWRSLIE